MILTDVNKKWLADKIDDAIKLNGFLELIDGYAARVIISYIDSFVDGKLKVSEFLKEKLNALVEAAKNNDIEQAEVIAAEIIDSLVDIPGIDDDAEKLLFEGAVKMVVGAIKSYLKK